MALGGNLRFFIAGAPKCGTTSLYAYLRRHSCLFLPDVKEPHFFASDLPLYQQAVGAPKTLADYLELFACAPAGTLWGEASVWYLYSHRAIPWILELNPQARFVVMVRNPVEMAYSLYWEFVRAGVERASSFEEAWALQARRRPRVEPIPGPLEPRFRQYRELCALGSQLERFYQIVPARQRLVILLEDWKRDTAGEYCRVLEFLGVPYEDPGEFAVVNAGVGWRYGVIERLLRSRIADLVARFGGPALRRFGLAVRQKLRRWNLGGPLPALAPETRAVLVEAFWGEIEKLAVLLRRDLSHWLAGGAARGGGSQPGREA